MKEEFLSIKEGKEKEILMIKFEENCPFCIQKKIYKTCKGHIQDPERNAFVTSCSNCGTTFLIPVDDYNSFRSYVKKYPADPESQIAEQVSSIERIITTLGSGSIPVFVHQFYVEKQWQMCRDCGKKSPTPIPPGPVRKIDHIRKFCPRYRSTAD